MNYFILSSILLFFYFPSLHICSFVTGTGTAIATRISLKLPTIGVTTVTSIQMNFCAPEGEDYADGVGAIAAWALRACAKKQFEVSGLECFSRRIMWK